MMFNPGCRLYEQALVASIGYDRFQSRKRQRAQFQRKTAGRIQTVVNLFLACPAPEIAHRLQTIHVISPLLQVTSNPGQHIYADAFRPLTAGRRVLRRLLERDLDEDADATAVRNKPQQSRSPWLERVFGFIRQAGCARPPHEPPRRR